MKINLIFKKNLKLLIFAFLLLAMFSLFFSDYMLLFIFHSKIWAHKVNRMEQLNNASKLYSGVELDIVFHANENYFEVNHPPDSSLNLKLSDYLTSPSLHSVNHIWLDFKNLTTENQIQATQTLDSIVKLSGIKKTIIFVESPEIQRLISFQNKGFQTSYYLPTDLQSLAPDSLLSVISKIKQLLASNPECYISAEFSDYPILKKYFPEKKKLLWFAVYGSMNKLKARILLYQIAFDSKVDALLIPL